MKKRETLSNNRPLPQDARVIVGDSLDDNIGRDVGPYRIIERLGRGGMGEVYLAHDTTPDRRVALKILPRLFRRRRHAPAPFSKGSARRLSA